MIIEDFKVGAAAVFGFGSPAINWVFNVAEPLLKTGLLLGQIGVAVVTIIYIVKKIRGIRK